LSVPPPHHQLPIVNCHPHPQTTHPAKKVHTLILPALQQPLPARALALYPPNEKFEAQEDVADTHSAAELRASAAAAVAGRVLAAAHAHLVGGGAHLGGGFRLLGLDAVDAGVDDHGGGGGGDLLLEGRHFCVRGSVLGFDVELST